MSDSKHRYERHTWPEIREAVDDEKMVIIPTACVEDHGHHLPIDMDIEAVKNISRKTAQEREDTLVYPVVQNGYDPHHMNFPGTTSIDWETYINHLIDIGTSLTHHGFKKILFLNGHGSNHHLVHQASRQVIIQDPDVQACMLSWWQMEEIHDVIQDIGEGGPEGSAHAGEIETSLYRYLHPDAVDMDKAVREIGYPDSKHFYQSSRQFTGETRPGTSTPVTMMEWWSTFSESGVKGDATVATEEKGEAILKAAKEGLHSILDDLSEFPIRETTDHHSHEVSERDFDRFRPR